MRRGPSHLFIQEWRQVKSVYSCAHGAWMKTNKVKKRTKLRTRLKLTVRFHLRNASNQRADEPILATHLRYSNGSQFSHPHSLAQSLCSILYLRTHIQSTRTLPFLGTIFFYSWSWTCNGMILAWFFYQSGKNLLRMIRVRAKPRRQVPLLTVLIKILFKLLLRTIRGGVSSPPSHPFFTNVSFLADLC